jgi:hypothetical protein
VPGEEGVGDRESGNSSPWKDHWAPRCPLKTFWPNDLLSGILLAMRKGWLIAGGAAVALVIEGSIYGLYRIVTAYWDFPSAAKELPAALEEYRANGLPHRWLQTACGQDRSPDR